MQRVVFENITTTGKTARTISNWNKKGDLIDTILEEYKISDVCMGELLASTYISGMTLEDQVILYAKLMKRVEEDKLVQINEEEKTYKELAEEQISYYGIENELRGMKLTYKGLEHNINLFRIEKRKTGEIIEFSFNEKEPSETDDGIRTIVFDDIHTSKWWEPLDKMSEASRPLDREEFAEEEYEWNLISKDSANGEEKIDIKILSAELFFTNQMKIVLGTDKIIEMNRVLK